jgi:hypothetical protein
MLGLRSLSRKTRRQFKRVPNAKLPILLPKRKPIKLSHIPSGPWQPQPQVAPMDVIIETKTESKDSVSECRRRVYSYDRGMSPTLDVETKSDIETIIHMTQRNDLLRVLEVELVKPGHSQPFQPLPEWKEKLRTFTDRETLWQLLLKKKEHIQILTIHGTPEFFVDNICKIGFNTNTVWSSQSATIAWWYANKNRSGATEPGSVGYVFGCHTYLDRRSSICSYGPGCDGDTTFAINNFLCLPFCVLKCELLSKLYY